MKLVNAFISIKRLARATLTCSGGFEGLTETNLKLHELRKSEINGL